MKCHYVPQRYLLRFCSPSEAPFIWRYDKQERCFLHLPVNTVALEHEFYSGDVEKDLAQHVEGPANAVIDSLIAGRAIAGEQRARLAFYVGVMLKRVPAHRERAWAMAPGVIEDSVKAVVARIRELADRGEVDPVIAEHRVDEAYEIPHRYSQSPPPEIVAQVESPWPSQETVLAIASMNWRVATSAGPAWFLTTDNPAFFFSGYGLGNPESELCLPLSSSSALFGTRRGPGPLLFHRAPAWLVREANRRLASTATRYLFYHARADWVETLALKKHPYLSEIGWV